MSGVQTLKAVTGAILATTMLAGVPIAQAVEVMPGSSVMAVETAHEKGESRWDRHAERQSQSQGQSSRRNYDRIRPQQGRNDNPQQARDDRPRQTERSVGSDRSAERSGRDWNRSDRRSETANVRSGRDWNQSAQSDGNRIRPNRDLTQGDRREADRGDRDGRNRSYTDRDRNRTYTDGNRTNWGDRNGWRDRDSSRYSYRDRDGDRYRDRDRDHRRWDRRWRDNHRYDWNHYRSSHRNIYRVGRYYSPYRDYRYRRLSIGFSLGSMFYSSRYWINDPWRYRLPDVYGPYRWVRYYDDVLLVDMYSGEVVDVIYDFFW